MQIVPLVPSPSQTLTVSLSDQTCQIDVFQKAQGLFVNLYVNNVLIVAGVIAQNLNRIVRSAYLGFVGDLAFIDNQGEEDPYFTGLGTRFELAYLLPAELP